MFKKIFQGLILLFFQSFSIVAEEIDGLDIIDMTRPTDWQHLSSYYGALDSHSDRVLKMSNILGVTKRKMCLNCGAPTLGTAMHLDHSLSMESMHPAVIPAEYFITRVNIVDVTSLSHGDANFVLTLDIALQWAVMKRDPKESTLLLFKFGWKAQDPQQRIWTCHCKIPGLSFELAEWISMNMSHVVGVATDAPSLESEQTREFATRTVANMLGKSGVYMIENLNIRKNLPEQSCLAIISPLKLLNANYVPTTVTAFCPSVRSGMQVALALRRAGSRQQAKQSRMYDVNLDEILHK